MKLAKGIQKKKPIIQKYCEICKNENNHFYECNKVKLSIKYWECCNTCGTKRLIGKKTVKSTKEWENYTIFVMLTKAKEELDIKNEKGLLSKEIMEYERSVFFIDLELERLSELLDLSFNGGCYNENRG